LKLDFKKLEKILIDLNYFDVGQFVLIRPEDLRQNIIMDFQILMQDNLQQGQRV
jgi:hypothetical protein